MIDFTRFISTILSANNTFNLAICSSIVLHGKTNNTELEHVYVRFQIHHRTTHLRNGNDRIDFVFG